MAITPNEQGGNPPERYSAVRDVILYNHGPGTAWINAESNLSGSDGKDFGVGLAPGERMTVRTWQVFYAYGDPADPTVTLPGGAGTAHLAWMIV